MSAFDDFLGDRLAEIDQQQLRRRLRVVTSPQGARAVIDGRELLHFSSNDYLGLANHPLVKYAATKVARDFGIGSGASRLISGSQSAHHELEESLAQFKGTEAALVFSTGYATALGVIPALLSREDFIVMDRLVHASIVDGARLSGATMRIFAHNDLNDLADILKWCDGKRGPKSNVLIVTESLFSMDGDLAPLREIADLKDQHNAWLMVDEAHATALFGPQRRGRVEECGVSGRVEVQMGTLGKALGASGGFICGSRRLVDYLVNRARSFVFSTAAPACASAAVRSALEIVRSAEGAELLRKLRTNIAAFRDGISPIVPVVVGEEKKAVALSQSLLERGIFVPAIRFPTVARNKARLRISFSASHLVEDVKALATALNALTSEPQELLRLSAE